MIFFFFFEFMKLKVSFPVVFINMLYSSVKYYIYKRVPE